jgi:hypothetical protein
MNDDTIAWMTCSGPKRVALESNLVRWRLFCCVFVLENDDVLTETWRAQTKLRLLHQPWDNQSR